MAAATDQLTGLLKREGLRDDLTAEPAIYCWVDVDGLIWTNDQFDHTVADQALVSIAKFLVSSLGEKARSIYRVGGEEFLAVLRTRDVGTAREIAAGIVSGVRALAIPYRRPDRPHRTVHEVNVAILPSSRESSGRAFSSPGTSDWVARTMYFEKERTGREAGVVLDLSVQAPMMTVGALKRYLEQLPDDAVLAMSPPATSPSVEGPRIQALWPSFGGGPVLSFVPAKGFSDEFRVEGIGDDGKTTIVQVEGLAEGKPGQRVSIEITREDGYAVTVAATIEWGVWVRDARVETPAFKVDGLLRELYTGRAKVRVVAAA